MTGKLHFGRGRRASEFGAIIVGGATAIEVVLVENGLAGLERWGALDGRSLWMAPALQG